MYAEEEDSLSSPGNFWRVNGDPISYVSGFQKVEDFPWKNIANTFGGLHFAIHSARKLSVSLEEDEGDALSKDLGMHGDVS